MAPARPLFIRKHISPITGFEPRTSRVSRDCSTNWAQWINTFWNHVLTDFQTLSLMHCGRPRWLNPLRLTRLDYQHRAIQLFYDIQDDKTCFHTLHWVFSLSLFWLRLSCTLYLGRYTSRNIHRSWSSLVAGDECSYLSNGHSNLGVVLHALSHR